MRFLKLSLVVNGTYIYPLLKNKPILITIPSNPSRIVVTDGYHITSPMELRYHHARVHYLQVVCGIENGQLLVGLVVSAVIYMMGLTSDILFLQLLSLAPIFYFLFIYYIKRKEFIQIKPA